MEEVYDFNDVVRRMLDEGQDYKFIINKLKKEMTLQALIRTRGNQAHAAKMIGANRGSFKTWMSY